MPSWKNKFKGKLPLLFSDHSYCSSSSSSSSHSSASSDDDQTRLPFKDASYISSILSFFFHSTEPTMSLTTSSLKSISCKTLENSNTKEENKDHGSGKSTRTNSSEVFEDATDLQTPRKQLPNINLDSEFISSELYIFFESCLPNIVKGCQWLLLYSTLKHGISLRTLIRSTCDLSGPCLLITGDTKGAVFGGLLNCPLTPTPTRKYQGTYQTFVFTTLYGPPTLFRSTGANRYFFMCLNDMLAFGGGGSFALRLDGDLLSGTSGTCDTFGNRCLAHNEDFEVKNVELWGFTHLSRYHS
ncbi:uncharacterized protein [Rutidosis leptorrhynchoides]|uniref:uncharacterized protein n=1 Tax=Rutidosis leptorrhynchoides TaxID=125765 RepID=UPI003A993B3D